MIGATAESVRYSQDLGSEVGHIEWPCAVVCTMEEPWALVQKELGVTPLHVHYVAETGITYLRTLAELPPGARRVVGIGGGSSIDAAKYLGWVHSLPVTVIPTIVSVDAMVTPAIAVRTRNIVKYIGNCAPEEVIVCDPIVRAAPARLNRAGISDVLSCHTAQFDWRLAEEQEQDVRDERVSRLAREVIDRCSQHASEIRGVTPMGIRALIEGFCAINDLTLSWGSARMEEGSEHFFAYNVERITRRHFVHGELVALGILVMSLHQNNTPEAIKETLDEAGVEYRPEAIGLADHELREALATLGAFVREVRLWYSAIDYRAPEAEKLTGALCELIG